MKPGQHVQPPGWPEGLVAEPIGIVSCLPVPGRIGRREWVASAAWIRACDMDSVEVASAEHPARSVRIPVGATLASAIEALKSIGLHVTRSRAGLRDFAVWLAEALPGGNPWAERVAA